jgi:hypothetical protein
MLVAIVILGTAIFLSFGMVYARRHVPPYTGGPLFPSQRPAPRPARHKVKSKVKVKAPSTRQRRRRGMRELDETRRGERHGPQFWAIVNHPDSDLEDLKGRGRDV